MLACAGVPLSVSLFSALWPSLCPPSYLGSSLAGLAVQNPASVPPAGEPPRPVEYEIYYHHTLRNTTDHLLEGVRVYLPMPVDDSHQTLRELRIETGGEKFNVSNRKDAFGTPIRRILIPRIEREGEVHVGFSCVVELSPPAKVALDPSRAASLDDIPKEVRDRFTGDDPIFGLKTEVISAAAAALLRDHPHPVARATAIHDLVAGTFAYKPGDGWDHAPEVLARRSGSCSEFAYVFCALCRATGIPTRFVGASIFPMKSAMPFEDRAWHRWAEAYLPGYGWVPFDPTLDRAKPPRADFVGGHHSRVLILTRIGTRSQQLGLSYIGSNSHTGETSRKRTFTWSQGTRAQLERALALAAAGKDAEARQALARLAAEFPGTRAAQDARAELAKMAPDLPAPR